MSVNSTDTMGCPMPGFRLLVILTTLTLTSRMPLRSQEPGFEDTSVAEFYSFEAEPLRRLQFIGEAAGAVIGDGNRYAENEEFWWMAKDGRSVYAAGLLAGNSGCSRLISPRHR